MKGIVLCALAAVVAAGAGWTQQDISNASPNFEAFEAFAITANGQVLGNGTRDWEASRAFLWQNGKLVDLGVVTAAAVNDRGQVVGFATRAGRAAPFVWQGGKLRYLSPAGAAVAINSGGAVVGWSATRAGAHHAALWQQGRVHDLGTLGGAMSEATAVNVRGDVVGWSQVKSGVRHAFSWSGGRMRDLGVVAGARNSEAVAVNVRGQVVGLAYSSLDGWGRPASPLAVVWQGGKATTLGRLSTSLYSKPSDVRGYPIAINDKGQVAGGLADASHESRAFRWERGRLTYLPALPGAALSGAVDVNERGQIVGWSAYTADPTAGTRAVVWENGAVTDLSGLSPQDEAHVFASAINEHDQIVGTYTARMDSARALVWHR